MEFYVILTVLGLIFFMSHAAPLSKKLPAEKGEYGNHFEGDIMLTAAQRAEIEKEINDPKNGNVESRNGKADITFRWPKKTVVYYIDDSELNKKQIKKIYNAMSDIEDQSCIKFRERKSEDEYALIFQGTEDGCYSYVGYIGSQPNYNKNWQELNLGKGCFGLGTIEHEILHALGFYHMQSSYDRDDYVTIVWKNIKEDMWGDFMKHDRTTNFGIPYDYGSVMHYKSTAFSKNEKDTIVPKKARQVKIGQRCGLSEKDILKLNRMYECPEIEESNEI